MNVSLGRAADSGTQAISGPVGIIGLGHVGASLLHAVSTVAEVIGHDRDPRRIKELERDVTPRTTLSSKVQDLASCTTFVVAVPTPVDQGNKPDLTCLRAAMQSVAAHLKHGDLVINESTVAPGATEEICIPILEAQSGLKAGRDFFIGYSPERINPGDAEHSVEKVSKIVSGHRPRATARMLIFYAAFLTAPIHIAPSVRVAEAAKLVENVQRDVNIALMNELSDLLEGQGIAFRDVLSAASTKWNFGRFHPGLVGGTASPWTLITFCLSLRQTAARSQ